MGSCDPLLAAHFLLEKQVGARASGTVQTATTARDQHWVRKVALTAPLLLLARRCFLFEDPGSALKGGVKVCKRRLVNEVLGLFLTEFFPDSTHKGATPIQRGL
jgi:hypothetical protein